MRERRTVDNLSDLRRAYNDLYDRTPLRETPRFYRWVLEMFPGPGRHPLLDIACGVGGMVRIAHEAGWEAIGVDLSDRALAMAREEGPSDCWILADGARLPFPDASFDRITHLGNLEHFLEPAAGVREVTRLLTPDGKAIVMLPNSYYSGDLWRVIRGGYGPNHHQAIDRFATINEWRDLLEENGLAVETIHPYNKFKWWKKLLPRNLAYHFVYICRRESA